jgi:alkylation response protein AidB-like acyl-CoA dehydrogenase
MLDAVEKKNCHEEFGFTDVPFGEPSWYFGNPSPYYNKNHVAWRNKVRTFIQREIRPYAHKWDEAHDFPVQELRKKAYNAGVLCPYAPVELGGTPPEGGWDQFMNLIWLDEICCGGAAGASVCTFFITQMSLPHTLMFGTDDLKKRVAEPVIRGEAGICITLTEPQGGSDLAQLTTTAELTPDGKHYIVNGSKKFITGGTFTTFFSTLVRTSGEGHSGLSLLIIEADLPGITVRKLPATGWWSGNTTSVTFDNVKVRADNLIGNEGMGFFMMATVMNGERIVGCVGSLRAARSSLSEAIRYARQRNTFGKRLIDHQVIRHKIMHMARQVEACQAFVEQLCFQIQNGASVKEIGGLCAMAKVQCTQTSNFAPEKPSRFWEETPSSEEEREKLSKESPVKFACRLWAVGARRC